MDPISPIDFDPHLDRSLIVAAAFGSDMPTWQFEELVSSLYGDEFGENE